MITGERSMDERLPSPSPPDACSSDLSAVRISRRWAAVLSRYVEAKSRRELSAATTMHRRALEHMPPKRNERGSDALCAWWSVMLPTVGKSLFTKTRTALQ